jgi:hypothetical protein
LAIILMMPDCHFQPLFTLSITSLIHCHLLMVSLHFAADAATPPSCCLLAFSRCLMPVSPPLLPLLRQFSLSPIFELYHASLRCHYGFQSASDFAAFADASRQAPIRLRRHSPPR